MRVGNEYDEELSEAFSMLMKSGLRHDVTKADASGPDGGLRAEDVVPPLSDLLQRLRSDNDTDEDKDSAWAPKM